jgi:prepilin-type N-terminal cleavage/methylation domain-containing protein
MNTEDGADTPYALCGSPEAKGFTLLEVMIAMAVFFIVVFAVLGMVVQSLGAARALQVQRPDAGMLAAMLSLSNVLEEGFPDWAWERQIVEVGTNGLFQVDFRVFKKQAGAKDISEDLTILMHKPGGPRVGIRR